MTEECLSLSKTVEELIGKIELKFPSNEKLKEMFERCFLNTLHTTTEIIEDGSSFVFTGDIPAMWLRDSTAQVRQYLPLAGSNEELGKFIEGLIKRQMMYVTIDSYANAFNKEANNQGHKGDITKHNPWVWERKYEVDSLCSPIQLAYLYWKATGRRNIFTEEVKNSLNIIINLWKEEQRHSENSTYYFKRENCSDTDTLNHNGKGAPVNYTGMTWSGFRPSDDSCMYGYLIPSNMFAVVVLEYVEEIAAEVYKDDELKEKARLLREQIDKGINTYGIYDHPKYGRIYAYETDGHGNYNLMDDANVPSLLSIPYLGYKPQDTSIYENTRRFILSKDNPYYFEGEFAKGMGSPHTPKGFVWHIGIAMQALTSNDQDEIAELIAMLISTDADTGFMHESFNPNNPKEFTRDWFAWANSLFAELIYREAAKAF